MKVSARDVVRVAAPLLAARAIAPFVARFVPLPAALSRARVANSFFGAAVDVDVAAEVVQGIEALLRTFPRGSGTCLTRALGRAYALRRAGIPVRFVLGVRSVDGKPEGHSWHTLDDKPFLEANVDNLRHFQVVWQDPR